MKEKSNSSTGKLILTSIRNILTSYFLPERILRRRWLVPIGLLTILVLYHYSVVLAVTQQVATPVNAWDVVVDLLNSRLSIHHGLTNLLLFLVSDISLLEEFDHPLLLKAGSRWRWFQVQAICSITVVILYIALISIIILGVTITTTSWSLGWSPAAESILNRQGLPANIFLAISPLITSLLMLTLLGFAWIGISLVVSAITLATQKSILGFAAGLTLNYSALIIWLNDISFPLLGKLWFHQRMFFWYDEAVTGSIISLFAQSTLYWILWIATSLVGLWYICRSINVIEKKTT